MKEINYHHTTYLDKSSSYFKGHFDNYPILAGVYHIELVANLLKDNLGSDLHISKIIRTKFCKKVLPGTKINISAKMIDDEIKWHIKEFSTDLLLSHGKFTIEL